MRPYQIRATANLSKGCHPTADFIVAAIPSASGQGRELLFLWPGRARIDNFDTERGEAQVPVRMSGWLLYDFEHVNAIGTQRASVWEVHPITKIQIQRSGQWVDLTSELTWQTTFIAESARVGRKNHEYFGCSYECVV